MDNRDNGERLERNERDVALRNNGRPCGCGPAKDCGELMHQLQMLDFSLVEIVLYLDAYPDSCEALAYYQDLLEKREAVAAVYEAQCGPLTAIGPGNVRKWNWTQGPWPWEPGFPGNARR